jgi:hypothetical protein
MIRNLLIIATLTLTAACAGPQITRVQPLSETADVPYDNVLVISMFDSFDMRRYLEGELVRELKEQGVTAVASTSMMDTKTPVTRQTFLDMVEARGSDAVLITTLASLDTSAKTKDANPESTHIVRPTYYYNVWSVELTEFVGPQDIEFTHSVVLSTQLYSVSEQEPVWSIESKTKLARDHQNRGDTTFITNEAKAIVSYLSRDGLLAP